MLTTNEIGLIKNKVFRRLEESGYIDISKAPSGLVTSLTIDETIKYLLTKGK